MIAFLISGPRDQDELVIAALHEAGTAGIEERPDGLLAYFDDPSLTPESLAATLGVGGLTVEPAAIPDVDWVARYRENFRAFAVGSFWISPDWAPPAPPPDHRLLVVDPGRAFGTGTHESTALCLLALERLAAERPLGRVLDVGTGSGILAVAAAQLGATIAMGADNDPEAVESARTHARLNGVALRLALADGGRPFRPARWDTVLANITAPLLIARAAEIGALARSGGRIVLAGLLAEELPQVSVAYAPLGVLTEHRRGEWASLTVAVR